MRIVLLASLAMTVGITGAVAGTAQAQERKIARADLPAAVDSAVRMETRSGTLRGLSEEREHGHKYYEAELLVHGRHRDVLMDSTGAVVEVEEQVSLDSVPAKARAALTARAEGGRISQVEALSKRGRLVAYEAQVTSGAKRREIQVSPEGKSVAY